MTTVSISETWATIGTVAITAVAGDILTAGAMRKIGDLVLESAELIVWLDLPLRVWLPRLARRTWRRYRRHEELWNGNRETLRDSLWGRDSLFGFALRSHFRRRREWPRELSGFNVLRLRTPLEVERFLAGIQPAAAQVSRASSMNEWTAGEGERS